MGCLIESPAMKHSRLLLLAAFGGCLAFTDCSQNSQQTQGSAATGEDESEKPPFVGMTKNQALARYGDPKTKGVTEEGETWTYVRGLGAMMAKAAIPFYFGGRDLKTGVLIFGPDGKVKKFRWDTQTDD